MIFSTKHIDCDCVSSLAGGAALLILHFAWCCFLSSFSGVVVLPLHPYSFGQQFTKQVSDLNFNNPTETKTPPPPKSGRGEKEWGKKRTQHRPAAKKDGEDTAPPKRRGEKHHHSQKTRGEGGRSSTSQQNPPRERGGTHHHPKTAQPKRKDGRQQLFSLLFLFSGSASLSSPFWAGVALIFF